MLLDIVLLDESHTGLALAVAFAQILENFGIADKVLLGLQWKQLEVTHLRLASQYYM
jgi:hypothetical protein